MCGVNFFYVGGFIYALPITGKGNWTAELRDGDQNPSRSVSASSDMGTS